MVATGLGADPTNRGGWACGAPGTGAKSSARSRKRLPVDGHTCGKLSACRSLDFARSNLTRRGIEPGAICSMKHTARGGKVCATRTVGHVLAETAGAWSRQALVRHL